MTTRQRQQTLDERLEAARDDAQYLKTQCVNAPLARTDARYGTAVEMRQRLGHTAFTTGTPPVSVYHIRPRGGLDRIYLGPADAYTVAFLALLDSGVVELVKRTFADERTAVMRGERLPIDERRPRVRRRQQPDEPGVIYCFWNTLDRPELKKIGRTRRRAEQRGREWEAELTPEEGQQIVILFSVPTRYNVFAERVVHRTLLCEHQGGRVNERTGRLLTEYYRVENVMALKLFVMLCIGYIDQWGDSVRREFETTSLYAEWLAVMQRNW